jgi:hypothetical protein
MATRIMGFHFFRGDAIETARLRDHCAYIAGFLEPALADLARQGHDAASLRRGVTHLRSLADLPGSSFTNVVYRGAGLAPHV